MTTNTAGTNARQHPLQLVHYFRRTVTFSDGDGSFLLGNLPTGAQLLHNLTAIKTAFTGSGVALSIGTNSTSYNNIDAFTTGATATTTVADVVSQTAMVLAFTADTDVYIKITAGTTTAPTAGSATVVLSFVPDNDQ